MHRDTDAVGHERFNLHAAVTLADEDEVRRERLCGYLMSTLHRRAIRPRRLSRARIRWEAAGRRNPRRSATT